MSVVTGTIALLLSEGTPFALVEGAAELSAVKDTPRTMPAAYVLVTKEESADPELVTGPVLQRTERDVTVVIVTENLTDSTGAAAVLDVDGLKAWVRGRLLGWMPDDGKEPVSHVAWEIIQATDGVVWGQDTFSSPTYLEASNA